MGVTPKSTAPTLDRLRGDWEVGLIAEREDGYNYMLTHEGPMGLEVIHLWVKGKDHGRLKDGAVIEITSSSITPRSDRNGAPATKLPPPA